ncbi:MAG TPA: hypothetical protein VI953_01180 [Candidatus Paceibacterota bacterium]
MKKIILGIVLIILVGGITLGVLRSRQRVTELPVKVLDYQQFVKDSYPVEGDGYALNEYTASEPQVIRQVNQIQVVVDDPINFGSHNPSAYVIWSNLDGSNKRVVYYLSNTNIGGLPDVSPSGSFFVADAKYVMSACLALTSVDYASINNGEVGEVKTISEINGIHTESENGVALQLSHDKWLSDNEVELVVEYYDSRCGGELIRTEKWAYNLDTKEYKQIIDVQSSNIPPFTDSKESYVLRNKISKDVKDLTEHFGAYSKPNHNSYVFERYFSDENGTKYKIEKWIYFIDDSVYALMNSFDDAIDSGEGISPEDVKYEYKSIPNSPMEYSMTSIRRADNHEIVLDLTFELMPQPGRGFIDEYVPGWWSSLSDFMYSEKIMSCTL